MNYSGAPYYTQIVNPASKTALVDALYAALIAAGWSHVSGSSGNYTVETAATPDGLACQCTIDNTATNCARFWFKDPTGTYSLSAVPVFMLPNAAETWEVYASPYHFFAQVIPWPSAGRKIGFGGTGAIPSHFLDGSPDECVNSIWQGGNATSDTDATDRQSLANSLSTHPANTIWNATVITSQSASSGTLCCARLVILANGASYGAKWAVDDSLHVEDVKFAWSDVGPLDAANQRIRCLPYDMIVVGGQFTAGDEITWDTFTWRAITHNHNSTLFALKA